MHTASPSALERHTTRYLRWCQVVDIVEEAGLSPSEARKIINAVHGTPDDPRKQLPGRGKPLYMRRVVLRLFGLLEESASA